MRGRDDNDNNTERARIFCLFMKDGKFLWVIGLMVLRTARDIIERKENIRQYIKNKAFFFSILQYTE